MWQVMVLLGAPDRVDAPPPPLRFGTTQVLVGHDGELSDPQEPLVLAPVMLHQVDAEIDIYTWGTDSNPAPDGSMVRDGIVHRTMLHPRITFDGYDEIRVEGFEERPDGAVVRAVWLVRPFVPEQEQLDGR